MERSKVSVGMASCGIAAGAQQVYNKLREIKKADQLNIELTKTGCIGMCYREPLVEITDDTGSYLYGEVNEQKAVEIMEKHIQEDEPVGEYIVKSSMFETRDDAFWEGQVKITLRNCGIIDPESITEYEKREGYQALQKIVNDSIPREAVIQTIIESGLKGRGGGGFETGLKWRFTSNNPADKKYMVCNADEGDPGAFMDRSLLEGDPHSVIEGLIIGAYATGASEGYIYCRAEYPLAIKRLNIAIEQARTRGYLGQDILGKPGFNFELYVKEGAGAFVCGEETALIASIEGRRGMPEKRPPYPSDKGLWGKPTNINNVETYANVPQILLKGAKYFNQYGTEKSKGTKVFALTGKINHGGSVEVPMGITIHDIIYKLGGGIQKDKLFKAVQLGGPSGGCIPAYLSDTPIDYESVTATGSIMGSGGMVVMDETTCMVDVAKFFLDFTCRESCGKCTFCRIGTKRMLEIITRITNGEGEEGDIAKLEELAYMIKENSLCGLGQTAPNPVLTTIKYFRDEYEAHIHEKKCPAKSCKGLLKYKVDPEKCTGCMVCRKNCPVNAISGERKEIHSIDQEVCIKCGICFEKCRFDAIVLS
jgi:NADH-quinone oxidoreductase subunit F